MTIVAISLQSPEEDTKKSSFIFGIQYVLSTILLRCQS